MSEPTPEAVAVAEATGKNVAVGSPSKHGNRMAMIILTIGSTLEDGTEVSHETWATGPTVNQALKDWTRKNTFLASKLKSRRVVTSGNPRDRVESERTAVTSRKMERAARP